MSAPVPTPTSEPADRYRDERDQLRARLDAFSRLLDSAERGGATVIRIADARRGLRLPAPSAPGRSTS